MNRPVTTDGLVRRTAVHLAPDPARVVAQLFIAGEELSSGTSRASPIMQRVLAMGELQVAAVLADTVDRFQGRHLDLKALLLDHFNQIAGSLGEGISVERQMLLGAYATNEYAIEAAALCNPSIVPHPDQTGLQGDQLRFVLSLRAVGEGHVSSIEFRTGIIGPEDHFQIDEPGHISMGGKLCPSHYDRERFGLLMDRSGSRGELVSMILDGLPARFTGTELDASIAGLHSRVPARREARDTLELIREVARSNYAITFPDESAIGQRVIRPRSPTESHGMEDARFVRFVEDDASATYYATYTAFDGAHVAPQLLQTDDFQTFQISQLSGRAATNKGMALFPRRINGRYMALSRWDRERNAVTTSADVLSWDEPVEVHSPEQPWELIQVGNCGSPIETAEGWLVLTHGVGPMRTYSLGAMLLDLEDPASVRGKLTSPLLSPSPGEREGYVPNVLYTCGAILHHETIVLPYAYGDRDTTVGLICLPELLDCLLSR